MTHPAILPLQPRLRLCSIDLITDSAGTDLSGFRKKKPIRDLELTDCSGT